MGMGSPEPGMGMGSSKGVIQITGGPHQKQ